MASTAEDIQEILDTESLLDLAKLKAAARHGLPDQIRSKVYEYWLGSQKSIENSMGSDYALLEKDNSDVMRRVRGEISRFLQSRRLVFSHREPTALSSMMENVLATFIFAHKDMDYSHAWVYLLGPFVYCFKNESEIYFNFEKWMQLWNEHFRLHSLAKRISHFLTLFMTLIPDLYKHFEEEEVDFKEFSTSWLSTFFAKECPMECTLRLWDVYLSTTNGLDLHVFTCLAILNYCKTILEDLEQSEIRAVLLKLPLLDMDQILSEAMRMQQEAVDHHVLELDVMNKALF